MRLDHQMLLKSPPLNLLAGSSPGYAEGRWFDSLWLVQGDAALRLQRLRLIPTELTSYPGVFRQQPSDKGKNVRIYKTLKQGCANHGPGAEVLWAVARRKGQIFKQALQLLKVLPGSD